ncbi:MAG: hypothetical protein KAU02_06230 [Tenericutes bacterium]|nr:hypothetical protein [Mycoplasmatota bacterium]
MIDRKNTWASLKSDYSRKEIFDGLFASILYATLIFVPVYLALLEIIVVYLYLLTLFSFIIIIALFGYVFVIHAFWKKSLELKKKEHSTNINKLFLRNTLMVNGVILVIGIFVIFVLIPILFV